MKFSKGTEFGFGTPNFPKISRGLFAGGLALMLVFHCGFPKAPDWITGIGLLPLLAGLIAFLFGIIAERREWEAKQKH